MGFSGIGSGAYCSAACKRISDAVPFYAKAPRASWTGCDFGEGFAGRHSRVGNGSAHSTTPGEPSACRVSSGAYSPTSLRFHQFPV